MVSRSAIAFLTVVCLGGPTTFALLGLLPAWILGCVHRPPDSADRFGRGVLLLSPLALAPAVTTTILAASFAASKAPRRPRSPTR